MSVLTLQRPKLRRYDVLAYICIYADEHNGVTPSVMNIKRHLVLGRGTVRFHLGELEREGFLKWDDSQIIILDSDWQPPPYYEP